MITLHLNFLTLCILFLSRTVTANAPVPSSDGFCASYIIQGYDTCALIARAHSITEADIEAFNTNTWAWLGCNQLYQDDFICLSTGKPPMPMALPNAVCGPQVPGTTRPANWADLASMNPCPASQCVSRPHSLSNNLTSYSVLHGVNAVLLRISAMLEPVSLRLVLRLL